MLTEFAVLLTQSLSLLVLGYPILRFKHVATREPGENNTVDFYSRDSATSKPRVDAVFF